MGINTSYKSIINYYDGLGEMDGKGRVQSSRWTHLFPSLWSLVVLVRRVEVLVFNVEEDEVHLRGQLGGGGEDEGDGGEDHHREGDEGVGLHSHSLNI